MYVREIFFFKQKTAYEMRISDWSSDVCSSDLWIRQHYRPDMARLAQADCRGRSVRSGHARMPARADTRSDGTERASGAGAGHRTRMAEPGQGIFGPA